MISYFSWSIIGALWGTGICAQKTPYTIPESVFLQAGLNTSFVAKFALFVAVLLMGTILIGKILKTVINMPSIAGQIIGGIILGPSCINIARISIFSDPFIIMDSVSKKLYTLIPSDLFVFFILLLSSAFTVSYLLWLAGYETNLKDLMKVGITALAAGILGAFVPIGFIGGALYYGFGGTYSLVSSLGIGLIFAATSVSIPVAMLVASNKMHLKSSQATLGAAIIDDIVAVILVSIFMMSVQTGVFGTIASANSVSSLHSASLLHSLVYMFLCSVVIIAFGFFFIPLILDQIRSRKWLYLMAPLATGMMLFYFAFAELVGGLAGITGAYFAGLFHRTGDTNHMAERVTAPFVNAILLPLFLGSIGLQVDITVLNLQQWYIAGLIFILAIISKLLGCYFAAKCSNLSGRRDKNDWKLIEIYLFGSSMVARGEVGLVIATILRGAYLIDAESYVLCVVVIVLTTIATPIMLSYGFSFLESESKNVYHKINIGKFQTIGIHHMFSIISRILSSHEKFNTKINTSEGSKIINLEEYNVKIFLSLEEGIILEGNQAQINEILVDIKEATSSDMKSIKEL